MSVIKEPIVQLTPQIIIIIMIDNYANKKLKNNMPPLQNINMKLE